LPVNVLPLPASEQPAARLLRAGSASLSGAEVLELRFIEGFFHSMGQAVSPIALNSPRAIS
jgi:DNA repair protein RadC